MLFGFVTAQNFSRSVFWELSTFLPFRCGETGLMGWNLTPMSLLPPLDRHREEFQTRSSLNPLQRKRHLLLDTLQEASVLAAVRRRKITNTR